MICCWEITWSYSLVFTSFFYALRCQAHSWGMHFIEYALLRGSDRTLSVWGEAVRQAMVSGISKDMQLNTISCVLLSKISSPDWDLSVNSYPDSNLNSSIDSDTSLNGSPDSDLSVNTSSDSVNQIRLIGGGNESYKMKSGDMFSSFNEFRNKFEIWYQDKCLPMKIGGSQKLPNSSPAFPYQMVRFLCKRAGKPRSRGQAKRLVQLVVRL